VFAHPWFIATLAGAYGAFATFFGWVCYKQTSWLARIAWFIAIMLLGNIAMAAYALAELFRAPSDGRSADLRVGRRAGAGVLGMVLAAVGMAVVGFALA
jgi:hypothetical protein